MFSLPATIELNKIETSWVKNAGIALYIARFDKVHPVISGNKLYKLFYFLEIAKEKKLNITTYGGAYSNHLVATAYACKLLNIPCKGIVRGEEPLNWSHTLLQCREYDMQVAFVSRDLYKDISNSYAISDNELVIPEGGYHPLGAKGAALMMEPFKDADYSHIVCDTGTATTIAGIMLGKNNDTSAITIPVIKNMTDIFDRVQYLTNTDVKNELAVWNDYHFGGYAKTTTELIHFMNQFYVETGIPTDIIYTAKLMYGLTDKIKKGYFDKGSNILCLHTGGLQGNLSLPNGTLLF